MCGICGQIYFDGKSVKETEIKLMMENLKHRGPDDEGLFIDNEVGLGHVRLSIIDLSKAGHQPMFCADKRFCIIHNGEVYNYLELKEQLKNKYQFKSQTDTEVILNSYIEWGPACLSKFNGMFAFAIYDTKTKEVFLCRDRFGIKPLYYVIDEKRLIFASEERTLLNFIDPAETNDKAIYEFLIYNRTDQDAFTFFKQIHKLPHGTYATIKDGKLRIKKWYVLENELAAPHQSPFDFYNSLNQSIKLRMRSDVPIGLCFSGGLDSSSILSILLKEFGLNDLSTFSAVYDKGETADESEFINEYDSILGNMHFAYPSVETFMSDLDDFTQCHPEPIPALGPYAQYKVMELAKQHVKVTLDGQGADEQLAGYHYFFGSYFKELILSFKFGLLISEVGAYIKEHKSLVPFKYLLFYMLPNCLKDSFGRASHNFVDEGFYNHWKKNSDIKNKLFHPKGLRDSLLQHFSHKLEHLLKWEDNNSMWHSLESRVPFLDHNVVEKTLNLPAQQIITGGNTKYILREAMRGVLPEKIRTRKDKKGFETPYEKWFRDKKFKAFAMDIFTSLKFKQRGILNSNRCLDAYQLHLKGRVNIAKEIWKWISLELWYQEFLDLK